MKYPFLFILIFNISFSFAALNDLPIGSTFSVEQFGAKADGITDSTYAIQNAINAATSYTKINGRRAEVLLGIGTYRLACPTNSNGTPDYCLHIYNNNGITFRGLGILNTKFIVSNPLMGFMSVTNSDAVTVSSFSVDYDPIPLAQGTVQSSDSNSFTVLLDSGFMDFNSPLLSDPKYNKNAIGILYDPKSNPPTLKKNVSSWFLFDSYTQISKNPNVWKMQNQGANLSFSPGDRFSFGGRTGIAHVLTFWASSNLLLSHVQILAGSGAATIWGLNKGEIEINDLEVKRIGTRLVSTSADAIHMASNTANVYIHDSLIEGMGDDAINIYHHGAVVNKVINESQFQFSTDGYNLYSVGQTLQIVDANEVVRGQAKITNLQLDFSNNQAIVTTDNKFPGLKLGDSIYDFEMASPNAIIENNVFNSFRGMFRMRSAHSLFKNNKINEISNAIILSNSDNSYREGPALPTSGITFVNNIINGDGITLNANEKSILIPTFKVTQCLMTIKICPDHPIAIGTFADDYNSASSNQSVCMQRATDFYNWCGIKSGSGMTTTADYISNGQSLKSITVGQATPTPTPAPIPTPTPIPASLCQMTIAMCPLHPMTIGTFADNYNNSSSNVNVCMQRATDFYNWCGINSGSGMTTKADYISNGQTIKSVTIGQISPAPVPAPVPTPTPVQVSLCQMNVTLCPLHPTTIGTFSDNYNNSSSNVNVCLQRATDFYNWCGIKPGSNQYTKASYLINNIVQKSMTVKK